MAPVTLFACPYKTGWNHNHCGALAEDDCADTTDACRTPAALAILFVSTDMSFSIRRNASPLPAIARVVPMQLKNQSHVQSSARVLEDTCKRSATTTERARASTEAWRPTHVTDQPRFSSSVTNLLPVAPVWPTTTAWNGMACALPRLRLRSARARRRCRSAPATVRQRKIEKKKRPHQHARARPSFLATSRMLSAPLCALLLTTAAATSALVPVFNGVCATYTGNRPNVSMAQGVPYFAWDTLPVYAHMAELSAGGLSDDIVNFVATHPFSLLILDKAENLNGDPVGAGGEDKLAATALRVKAVNPDMPVVFYQNTVKDVPYYDMFCKTLNLLLKNKQTLVTVTAHSDFPRRSNCNANAKMPQSDAMPVYDLTNPAMIAAYQDQLTVIASYLYGSGPLFAGVFLDLAEKSAAVYSKNTPTWTGLSASVVTNWDNGHAKVTSASANAFVFALANNINFNDGARRLARGYEQFMLLDFTGLSMYASVLDLMQQAANGRMMFANTNPCGPTTFNGKALTFDLGGTKTATYVRAVSMAGFLAGACRNSYYTCNQGFTINPNGYPTCWLDEYNYPLGAPLGAAKQVTVGAAYYFYRKFASGTYSILKTNSRTTQTEGQACVCWSNGVNLCSASSVTCASLLSTVKNQLSTSAFNNWTPDGCA